MAMWLVKRLAAWTKRAAGRAWSPDGSMTVSRRSGTVVSSGPWQFGHRRGTIGGRGDLVDRGSDAGLDRGEDRALDERRLADADPPPVGLVEFLQGELEAQRSAAQIEQDQRIVCSLVQHAADGTRDLRGAGPQASVLRPPGRGHRDFVAGDLGDHVAQPLDELAAVGDQ